MPDRRWPTVSVIVPVKDDVDGLTALLQALARQEYPGPPPQVLVVDNGSQVDLTPALQRLPGAVLLREDRPGSYAARNTGIQSAHGEVLAFTDADCLPAPCWLAEAVTALRGADVVAGAVQVFVRDARRPHPAEAWELVKAFQQERYVTRGGWCVTANMVTTRSVLERVGPFDERLRSGGDAEWGKRATAAGCRLEYAPAAVVAHPARTSYHELYTKLRRVQRGAYDQMLQRGERPGPWWREAVRWWWPPLGALRRARRDPRLAGLRAQAAYVAGEFFVRYASAAVRASEARRASA